MDRLKRSLAISGVAIAALVGVQVSQAPPAEAVVTTFACNPSPTGWNLEGDWGGGTVMESRTCLQADGNMRRVKAEFRVRDGGTPLSGTDWDLDNSGDGRPFRREIYVYATGVVLGTQLADPDVFNTSIVTRYSSWTNFAGDPCPGNYSGQAFDIRATPPGLPRSGYKSNPSNLAYICN